MKTIIKTLLLTVCSFLLTAFAVAQTPTTQPLSIYGGQGNVGDADPYTEYYNTELGDWVAVYLAGTHPWGQIPGTNNWLNYTYTLSSQPSCTETTPCYHTYRVRFSAPTSWSDAKMTVMIRADNIANVSFNGVPVMTVEGAGEGEDVPTANADSVFSSEMVPGINTITLVMTDYGGLNGFNYRIDMSVVASQPLQLLPALTLPPPPPVRTVVVSASECLNNGWKSVTRPDGSLFNSEQECHDYIAPTPPPPVDDPNAKKVSIFGTNEPTGGWDGFTEVYDATLGQWYGAYSTGTHPWGFVDGTSSWLSYQPVQTSSPTCTVAAPCQHSYRVRFNAPATWTKPRMSFQLKVDNSAEVSLNGTTVASVVGEGDPTNVDLAFSSGLRAGENVIGIVVTDLGGINGFNYRIDMSVVADQGFDLLPASPPPPPPPPPVRTVVVSASECLTDGWKNVTRADGSLFTSEQECTDYIAPPPPPPPPPPVRTVVTSASQCLSNGWNNVTRADGSLFTSEQDCVSYINPTPPPPVGPTQTLTILGSNAAEGGWDGYTEVYDAVRGQWYGAYSTGGTHPWGLVNGTGSWLSYQPTMTSDPACTPTTPCTHQYRVRFTTPTGWTNPKMTFQMKVDNLADVSLNGTHVASVESEGDPTNVDLAFSSALLTGENIIAITVTDLGGINGFNYRIDMSVVADQPMGLLPSSPPPPPLTVVTSAGQCLNNGWKNVTRADGALFTSELDCTNYIAPPPVRTVVTSASQCLNDGWKNVTRADASLFASEQDCVNYINPPPPPPPPTVVKTLDECRNDGWKNVTRANGTTFVSEQDCVTYVESITPKPVAKTLDQCKNDGWKNVTRADGTTFKNQGDCVSYVQSITPKPVVKSDDECKNYGWKDVTRADGTTFKNQGDCVSYLESLKPKPVKTSDQCTSNGWKNVVRRDGTAFSSESDCLAYVEVLKKVPTTVEQCKNNGWQTLNRPDGSAFKSQSDCLSFVVDCDDDHDGWSKYGWDGYNKYGYDHDGYDHDGYDRDGCDKNGYDRSGYNHDGYDRNGYGKDGYNKDGYDKSGYSKSGYDKNGYDKSGYNKSGYDKSGFDKSGYNKDGYDKDGCDKSGYTKDGFDKYGYDRSGYNKDGYDKNGYNKSGYDKSGYDKSGYNKDGYDKSGYNKSGFNKDGYDKNGFNKSGFDKNGFDKNGYNKDGYDKNGYNKSGYDKNGYDKNGFNKEGYDKNGYDKSGYNKAGYDKNGYDRYGYDKEGYNKFGYNKYGKKKS